MNKAAKRKSPFRYFETGTQFWKAYKASFFIGLCFSVIAAILLFVVVPSLFIFFAAFAFVVLTSIFSFGWATADAVFTRWFISYEWKVSFISFLSRLMSVVVGGSIIGAWAGMNSFSERSGGLVFDVAALLVCLYLLTHFVVTYFTTKDYLEESVEKTYSANTPKTEAPLIGPFRPAEGIINRLDKKSKGF